MTNIEKRFETTGPINLKVEQPVGDVKLTVTDEPVTIVRLIPHGRSGEELAERYTVEARGNDVVVLAPKKDGFLGLGLFKDPWMSRSTSPPEAPSTPARGPGTSRAGVASVDVRAATRSGDIAFDQLGDAELEWGSGGVNVQVLEGGRRQAR